MKCCVQCFEAKDIIAFINDAGIEGNCDYCGAEEVKTIDAEDLGSMFDPLLSLYEPTEEQRFHIDESLADAISGWRVFNDKLSKKGQNQILDEIRFGPLDPKERSITRSSDE